VSFTYDFTLAEDRDWVRFILRDIQQDRHLLEDEEIDAILAEEANKFLAAARLGETLLAKAGPAISKSVDGLSISYRDSAESAFSRYLQKLRERGCELLLAKPRTFHLF
jgi:hypothetical protein